MIGQLGSAVRSLLDAPAVEENSFRNMRSVTYEPVGTYASKRCDQALLWLPGGRRDRSQSTMFRIPAFITFAS